MVSESVLLKLYRFEYKKYLNNDNFFQSSLDSHVFFNALYILLNDLCT